MALTAGDLFNAEQELARRTESRKSIAKRVPLREATDEPQSRLEFEIKVFTEVLKMAAFRAESAVVNAVAPEYRRARHEVRKLIQEVLHTSGDLDVTDRMVTVRLDPLSSRHRTKVLEHLCEILRRLGDQSG